MIWVGMGLVLMLGRTVFWLCYRPFAPASAEEAPMITLLHHEAMSALGR